MKDNLTNILLTGSNGFIGTWVLKTLDSNMYHIKCLVRNGSDLSKIKDFSNIEIETVNYKDVNSLKESLKNIDVVIHLAGQMGGKEISWQKLYDGNVVTTENILKGCAGNNIKQFIYISTPGVQGFGHRKCKEEEKYAPRGDYEKSKVEAEQKVISICNYNKIPYTIIRPDFVYGPFDFRRVKMYKNIQNRKFILTTSGNSYLHPTYVADVAQGIVKAVNNRHAYYEIFNISAKNDITSLEYLNTIAKFVGKNLIHINIGYKLSIFLAGIIEKIFLAIRHEPPVTRSKIDFLALDHSTDPKKAIRLLGYNPEYTLEKGLHETIKWCRDDHLLK